MVDGATLWKTPMQGEKGQGKGKERRGSGAAADHMGIQKHGHLPKLNERHRGKHAPSFMSLGLQHKERQDTCAPRGILKGTTHYTDFLKCTCTRSSICGQILEEDAYVESYNNKVHILQDEVKSIPSPHGIFTTSTRCTVLESWIFNSSPYSPSLICKPNTMFCNLSLQILSKTLSPWQQTMSNNPVKMHALHTSFHVSFFRLTMYQK